MLRRMLGKLWAEERASASPEWAFLVTILVLGAITGALISKQAGLAPPEEPPAARSR